MRRRGRKVGVIFISHSSRNNEQAVLVRDWLREQGWAETFLDLDPEHGLAPGQRWQDELKKAGERCAAVVVLVSPEWASSKWCLTEFLVASQLGKLIFPIIVAPTPLDQLPTELVAHFQLADISSDERRSEGLDRLRIGLRRAGLDPRDFNWPPKDDPQRAPYRGLQTLEERDAAIFFGRDSAITKGLDALRRMRDGARERLLVILGASGSGKSSFLRAGLLSRLQRDNENYVVLPPMRPGRAALTGPSGLLQVLGFANAPADDASIQQRLEALRAPTIEAFRNLAAAAGETWSGRTPTLILPIDQGEEFFAGENAEAGPALDLLARILALDPDVVAIWTIRSDSFEQLQSEPRLASIPRLPFDLPRLLPAAFLDVIEGPGKLARPPVSFEASLSERLLSDLDAADALPLLAFTLQRLVADHGSDGLVELQEYERGLGGLSGAIARAVDMAFEAARRDPSLPNSASELDRLAREAFIPWLVRVDDAAAAPKRRVARLGELPEASRVLVRKFVDERLLVSNVDRTGEMTVEVSHEAVLRHWKLLAGWIEEERRNLRLLEEVRSASRTWKENEGATGGAETEAFKDDSWIVHRGERLVDVERAVSESSYLSRALDQNDHAYIAACRALRERVRGEELALIERERNQLRRRRRLQYIIAGVTAFAFVLTVTGGVLVLNERTKVDAERLRGQTSRAQVLADAALNRLKEGSPESALRLAVVGVREGSVVGDVESANAALARILSQAWPNGWLSNATGSGAINSYVETIDGSLGLTELSNARFLIWREGKEVARLGTDADAINATALARGSGDVVTGGGDGTIKLWRDVSGSWTSQVIARTPRTADGGANGINAIRVSDDAGTIYTELNSGPPIIWRKNAAGLYEGQALRSRDDWVYFVSLAPDGKHLFIRYNDGVAQLWGLRGNSWSIAKDFTPTPRGVGSGAFSGDGSQLAIATNGGVLEFWTLSGDAPVARGRVDTASEFPDSPLQASRIEFSPDGAHILASAYSTAALWTPTVGVTPLSTGGEPRFTPDGRQIVALNGKEFLAFDLSGKLVRSSTLAGFNPASFAFAKRGAQIVFTAWSERKAPIYEAAELTGALPGPPADAVWQPGSETSTRLEATAVLGNDGRLRILETSSGKVISEAAGLGENVADFGFAPDGLTVAALGADGVLHLINARTGLDVVEPIGGARAFDFASSGGHIRIATSAAPKILALPSPEATPSKTLLKRACEGALFNDELKRLTQVETQRVVLLQGYTGADVCQPLQAGESVDGRRYGVMPRSDALLFRKIAELVLKRQTSRPDPLSSATLLRGFISQAEYDAYRTKRSLSVQPVRELDAPEALSIILQTYWIGGHAVEMPTEGLSILVLDAALASGPKKAIELLQTAMVRSGYPVPEDGVFSAAMRKTLSDPATDVVALARSLIAVRREFFDKLASRNTSAARYVPAMLQTFDKLAADVEPLLAERKSVSVPSTATSAGKVEAEAGSEEKLTATQEQPPAILVDPEPNAAPAVQASGATTPQPVSLVHPPQLPPQSPGSGSSDTAVSEWGIELPSLGERPSARWWVVFAMFVASALLAMFLRRRSR